MRVYLGDYEGLERKLRRVGHELSSSQVARDNWS
jgi:hypothetical protein